MILCEAVKYHLD